MDRFSSSSCLKSPLSGKKLPVRRVEKPSVPLMLLRLLIWTVPFFGFGLPGGLRLPWVAAAAFVGSCFFSRRVRVRTYPLGQKVLAFVFVASLVTCVNLFDAKPSFFYESVTQYLQLLLMASVFVCVSSLNLTLEDLVSLLRSQLLVTLLVSLYAVYQVFARNLRLPFAFLGRFNTTTGLAAGGYIRVSSVFAEPSYLGAYLAPMLFLLASFLAFGDGERVLFRSERANLLALLLIVTALLASGSIAAYLSLFVGFLMTLANRETRKTTLTFATSVAVCSLLLSLTLPRFGIPFGDILDQVTGWVISVRRWGLRGIGLASPGARLRSLLVGAKVWLANPLFGVGLNNLQFHSVHHYPGWAPVIGSATNTAHNLWVQLLAETGILGFVSFVAVWVHLIFGLNPRSYVAPHAEHTVVLGLRLAIILIAVRAFLGIPVTDVYMWVNLSLAGLLQVILGRPKPEAFPGSSHLILS